MLTALLICALSAAFAVSVLKSPEAVLRAFPPPLRGADDRYAIFYVIACTIFTVTLLACVLWLARSAAEVFEKRKSTKRD